MPSCPITPKFKALPKERAALYAKSSDVSTPDMLSWIGRKVKELGPSYFKERYPELFPSDATYTDIVFHYYEINSHREAQFKNGYFSGEGKEYIFPPISTSLPKVDHHMKAVLENLSYRFNIPFEIIDDPTQRFKGKYVNDGAKTVVINLAYATPDTPFHEYFHPFVRIIKNTNPELYDTLATEALKIVRNTDVEEAIVEFLGRMAYRRTTLTARVMAYLSKILKDAFGIDIKVNYSTTVKNILDILMNEKVDVTSENSLREAFQLVDEAELQLGVKKKRADSSLLTTIRNTFQLTTDDTSDYYTDSSGKKYKRATMFVSSPTEGVFTSKYRNKATLDANSRAALIFRNQSKALTDKANYKGGLYSFDELAIQIDLDNRRHLIVGKLRHAFIEWKLEEDPAKKQDAFTRASKYAKDLQEPFKTLQTHPELYSLDQNFSTLVEDHIKLNTEGSYKDNYISELTVASQIMKDSEGNPLAGTFDLLVQRFNGDLRSIDFKSEGLLSDHLTSYLMPYGEKYGVSDSKFERNNMEQVLRMVMLKESFPEARFEAPRLIRITKYGDFDSYDADMGKYLSILGEYYRKTDKEVYNALTEKGLLNPENYRGSDTNIKKYVDEIEGKSRSEALAIIDAKIAAIHTMSTAETAPYIQKELAELARIRLEIEGFKDIDVDLSQDIGKYRQSFGTLDEMDYRSVQGFNSALIEARNKENSEKVKVFTKWDQLLEKFYEERPNYGSKIQMGTKKVASAMILFGTAFGFVSMNPFLLGAGLVAAYVNRKTITKTKSTFSFMFKKYPGKEGYFLNTTDEHEGRALTAAERDLRDYYISTIRDTYEEIMNEVVGTDPAGREITKARAMKLPATLPKDFFARVPLTQDEFNENFSKTDFGGVRSSMEYALTQSISNVFERGTHKTQDDRFVKVKYIDSTGAIAESEKHSFNPDLSFKAIMNNLLHKKHFDRLYPLAQGIKGILADAKTPEGKEAVPELLKAFDDQVVLQVLREPKEAQITSKVITFKVSPTLSKVLGVPPGTYKINQNDLLNSFKRGIGFVTMAFKFVPAVVNLANITLTNGIKFSTSTVGKLLGVNTDDDDVALSVALAYKDYLVYLKDSLTDNLENNKIHLMMKKFDWQPDNSDYQRSKKELLRDVTKPSIGSVAYMFHGITESYGSLIHLSAMMRARKVNGKSLYDLYEVSNGELVWTGGVRGVDKKGNEVTELDAKEIKALKRGYQKTQGGYRPEELASIESSVWGGFLTQFKRYFYTYTSNMLASDYNDYTTGKYMAAGTVKRPDGSTVPLYEWENEISKGRLRVLAGGIAAAASAAYNLDSTYLKEYYSGKEGQSRRLRSAELLSTMIWITLASLAALIYYDDDEEKETKQYRKVVDILTSATSGLHWRDYLSTMDQPIVGASRASALGKAFFQILNLEPDPFNQAPRTIRKTIPFLDNARTTYEVFGNVKWEKEDSFFGIMDQRKN